MTTINIYMVELPTVKIQVDEQSDDMFLFQVTKFYPNLLLKVTLERYVKLTETWKFIINQTVAESK